MPFIILHSIKWNSFSIKQIMIYCLITNDHLQLSTLRKISGKNSTKLLSFNDILSASCFPNSVHQVGYTIKQISHANLAEYETYPCG